MPRKKKQTVNESDISQEIEDFVVLNTSAKPTTEPSKPPSLDSIVEREIDAAVRSYNFGDKLSSVILDANGSFLTPTIDALDRLAENPQDDVKKILQINTLVSKRINMDDVIGKVVESIYVNINDQYKLNYDSAPTGRNKNKKLETAKALIDEVNDDINLSGLIREKTTSSYYEGNCILCLRRDETSGWLIDSYPLGVGIIAPYTVGGEPVILVNMTELKSRLQKAGFKYRSGKNMFFPTIEEEILSNYPEEVYAAYKNKDQYAKLDVEYTGVVRIGNLSRRYGLTPIFRALSSSIVLQSFYRSDEVNSKARSKKILHQVLRQQNTTTGTNAGIDVQGQAYAHRELISAYKQGGSIAVTTPNNVEKLEYVEASGELVDIKTIVFHLNREMSTLGIGFLSMESNNQSVSTAKISLEQLMKTINAITSQIERIIKKFYRRILIDEGIDPIYAPSIKILDSEYLEFALRKELSTLLYTTFNASLRTSLELVGIDYNDELERRKQEELDGISKIFKPRVTAFTNSGDTEKKTGRPQGEETDKQGYDDEYNKKAR